MQNDTARPGLQTRREEEQHPSQGAGNPYSQDMRSLVMFIQEQGDENNNEIADFIHALRTEHVYPSEITERRWNNLNMDLGHVRPCKRTGNQFSARLTGQNLILLAMYRVVYPKAIASEVNAFLYRANFGNPTFRFYSPSHI